MFQIVKQNFYTLLMKNFFYLNSDLINPSAWQNIMICSHYTSLAPAINQPKYLNAKIKLNLHIVKRFQ